jgi:predicted transcriptional regulator
MSGLEAFSLGCNIMTVIIFTLDTAEVCRNTRESGSSDKNLEESSEDIERTLNNVERLLQQQPVGLTKVEVDLRGLAAKCMGYNEDVQKELKRISPKNSTKLAALGSTVKTMMRRSHIDKLTSSLKAARKIMDSALHTVPSISITKTS